MVWAQFDRKLLRQSSGTIAGTVGAIVVPYSWNIAIYQMPEIDFKRILGIV